MTAVPTRLDIFSCGQQSLLQIQVLQLAPFSILLVFFWPVADTLVSIWRRWSLKRLPYQPDRLHFHQLVMRFLEIRFLGRTQRNISNPLATIFLIPVISVPQLLGVIYWNNFAATVWTSVFFFFGFLFVCSYIVGINLAKKIPQN